MTNYAHQKYLFDPNVARPLTLIGAGSVGSYVAFFLAKMGVTDITVWDGDIVESHNVPSSLYRPQDVGRRKVECLQEIVREFAGVELIVRPQMYDGSERLKSTVIACVDSMGDTGRAMIWERVKRNPSVDVFIDTRTRSAFVQVITISPSERTDINRYEQLLFPDETVRLQGCGEHSIAYASSHAAGIAAATLVQAWTGEPRPWNVSQRCDTVQRVL